MSEIVVPDVNPVVDFVVVVVIINVPLFNVIIVLLLLIMLLLLLLTLMFPFVGPFTFVRFPQCVEK